MVGNFLYFTIFGCLSLDLHKFEQGIQHHIAQGSCTVTYTLPDGGSSIPYYVPKAVSARLKYPKGCKNATISKHP